MKKLFILIVAALVSANVSAQFYLGAKAGVAASWTPNTMLVGNETVIPHNGFFGGATIGYDFESTICVESGIYYGSKGHSDRRLDVGNFSRNLHYLLVPVLGGLRFNDNRLSVLLGPEFGYLVGCSVKEGDLRYKDMESMNRFNILIAAELHYMFLDNLGAMIRLDTGLNRNFQKSLLPDDKATNLTVSIGLAYRFEL